MCGKAAYFGVCVFVVCSGDVTQWCFHGSVGPFVGLAVFDGFAFSLYSSVFARGGDGNNE